MSQCDPFLSQLISRVATDENKYSTKFEFAVLKNTRASMPRVGSTDAATQRTRNGNLRIISDVDPHRSNADPDPQDFVAGVVRGCQKT